MSKRLQVVLADSEFDEIRSAAERSGTTVSQWVRQALLRARRQESTGRTEARLAAVREAAHHSFPTGDVEQMLREIEGGYEE